MFQLNLLLRPTSQMPCSPPPRFTVPSCNPVRSSNKIVVSTKILRIVLLLGSKCLRAWLRLSRLNRARGRRSVCGGRRVINLLAVFSACGGSAWACEACLAVTWRTTICPSHIHSLSAFIVEPPTLRNNEACAIHINFKFSFTTDTFTACSLCLIEWWSINLFLFLWLAP